jgi:hypothetical protein
VSAGNFQQTSRDPAPAGSPRSKRTGAQQSADRGAQLPIGGYGRSVGAGGKRDTLRVRLPTVAGCVDIVVHLATEPQGSRVVREIVGVSGRVEGVVVELEPIFVRCGVELACVEGYPWALVVIAVEARGCARST